MSLIRLVLKYASSTHGAACLAAAAGIAFSGCAQLTDGGGKSSNGAALDLKYTSNPANYTFGSAITANAPTTDKPVQQYAVSPALPVGLSLNTTTGMITGTPTTITPTALYTIQATNAYGVAYVKLQLAINDHPPTITYGGSATLSYTVGTGVSALTPTLAGGTTLACSSIPALPAGLSISSACVLTGTPTVAATAATYQITAVNSGGSAALPLNITVIDIPPVFSYTSGTFSLVRGTAVTGAAGTPTSTGGVIASCASVPALPSGLSLAAGCTISGTPTTVTGSASYTITATNSGGSAGRVITVDVHDVAPAISFSPAAQVYTKGQAISAFAATNSGGLPTTCVSAPALPAGLALSTACVLSGTPTAVSALTAYTITATNSAGSSGNTLTLTINDVAPTINYVGSPFTYTHGTAISALTPITGGGTIAACSSSPTLPSGLSISATCVITGTPTIASASTPYTITATNTGGTASTAIYIKINGIAPNLTYSGSPYSFAKTVSVGTITPTNSGDAATSCASSPALPAGLSLSATCILSGTPTAITASAPYTITATNSIGSWSGPITIVVNDAPPAFTYTGSSYVYTRGTVITTLTPINTGGAIVSCASVPTLPTGLSLSATCVISGTPTAITSVASYAITGTNAGGTGGTSLTITVNDIAPAFSYAGSPFTYAKSSAITTLTPTSTGGTIVSCASSPAVPTGLSLSATCVLTGTPTVVSASTSYVITATNSGGTSAVSISIAVNDVLPNISYAGSPFLYTKSSAITTLTPTNTGGSVISCASSPSLPAGLALSALCAISGTPTVVTAATTFTITATNTAGSASTAISIQVKDIAPSITYAGSPFTYIVGTAITALNATNTGGAIVSCASVPTLPAGLTLSSICGVTGTPTGPSGTTSYTITATNTGGTSAATISIKVNDVAAIISYSGSPFTFTTGTAITSQTPTNTGGTIVSCASVPTLPTGLALSATCVISGTPSTITSSTSYTITATNTGGTGSATISITTNAAAPVIAFSGSPFAFTKSVAITTKTPTNTGGTVVSCLSAPTLPTGLALSATCVITGTPSAITATASYVITATNTGGTGSATISVTINDAAPAIDYIPTSYNFTYAKSVTITALTPNNSGGTITSCTANPALPSGLLLSGSTCSMTGTPTVVVSATSYDITATNSGGSSTATITITINDAVPAISYAGSPYNFVINVAITAKTPTNSGGTIATCSASPSLPSGLTISSTCVITGTGTVISAATTYTITAGNSGGSASTSISLAVNNNPPTISYTNDPFTLTVGVPLPAQTPINSGGAITSCASSPTLPSGLTLGTDCVMSGTPSVPVGATHFSVTATNSGGSASVTILIAANNGPPIMTYAGSPLTYSKTVAISTLTPTNTGGAITSCASSPALPSGLTLSTGCVISGTPSVASAAANYTITATNGAGTSAPVLNIEVYDSIPVISYSPSSVNYILRTAVSTTTPINTGGTITGCSVSPTLPTGLSLSSACVITGTPTAISAATAYTVTATNTGGSGGATITIGVKNQPVVTFHSLTALNGTFNGTAPSSNNIWKATQDGVDRLALTTNSSVGLDSKNPGWISTGATAVYSSKRAQNGSVNGTATSSFDIWTTDKTGTPSVHLTANTAASLDSDDPPVYSPDGTKVIYASKAAVNGTSNGTASSSYNIFIMNADGSGSPTALIANTNVNLDSKSPVFSPDGTLIYFSSKTALNGVVNTTPCNSYNIWRMAINGTGRTALTSDNTVGRDNFEPAISSDGTTVTWASKALIGATAPSSFNIWTMNFNGTAKAYLTGNTAASLDSRNPKFSPDMSQITFISKMNVNAAAANSFNVWIMDQSGLNQVALTTNNAASKDCEMPEFSPDNTKIAFSSKMNVGVTVSSSYNVFVVNSSGVGSPVNVTQNTNAGLDSHAGPFNIWYAE